MEYKAEIICRKTEYGDVCEWKGSHRAVAAVYMENIHPFIGDGRVAQLGEVFSYGRLRLRVVDNMSAWRTTKVGVMLESPHAQLYWLYREKAEAIVRFIRRCELAVRAFKGTLRIGETLPFTSRLADRLL
jgi:hypothetical protein